MFINKIFAVIFLLTMSMYFYLCVAHVTASWVYIDFNTSMQTKQFPDAPDFTKKIFGIDGVKDFFEKLYEKNNLSRISPQKELKIPKIIHQIWIGAPLPEIFMGYIRTWIERHLDGWEYKLWTDQKVKDLELYNCEYYNVIGNNGAKSDILKWEVIYQFGGVYIDMDFECLRSLDILHYTYDFYVGLQPLDTKCVQLGAGIFAARPGHPILKHCIETIKDDWHHKNILLKTGPIHFTKSFLAIAGKEDTIDIAFPATYFYPLASEQAIIEREKWIEEGAFGIHWWAKTWCSPQYRPEEFRQIKI